MCVCGAGGGAGGVLFLLSLREQTAAGLQANKLIISMLAAPTPNLCGGPGVILLRLLPLREYREYTPLLLGCRRTDLSSQRPPAPP